MRTIIALLAFIVVQFLAFAIVLVAQPANDSPSRTTGELRGRVVDPLGQPLIGATIRLEGTVVGGLSKAPGGEFSIRGIRPGVYSVVVSSIGRVPSRQSVQIATDSVSDVGTVRLESVERAYRPIKRIYRYGPFGRPGIERAIVISYGDLQMPRSDAYRVTYR